MFRCKKSLFVFLLPGLLGVMIFYIIPFIGGIGYSLTRPSQILCKPPKQGVK